MDQSRHHGEVVLVRVGWMKWYGSRPGKDDLRGGGSFNDGDQGSEVENFKTRGGTCYGYAQVSSQRGFNLKRIGGDRWAEQVNDVLVISVAKRPVGGGQFVVGWHSKATCFAKFFDRQPGYGLYNFQAACEDVVPLQENRRTWNVPRGKGGMGQANVMYTRTEDGTPMKIRWVEDLVAQIRAFDSLEVPSETTDARLAVGHKATGRGQGFLQDEIIKREVELYAMTMAAGHFRKLGFKISDHSSTESYDLKCVKGAEERRVEVKGTTGDGGHVLVTANEVKSAINHRSALFLATHIQVRTTSKGIRAFGGAGRCLMPWKPRTVELEPLSFRWRVPPDAGQHGVAPTIGRGRPLAGERQTVRQAKHAHRSKHSERDS